MTLHNERSHSFTCHPHVYPQVEWTIPAFTPLQQSVTALWLVPVLISRPQELRVGGWVGLGGLAKYWSSLAPSPLPPKTVNHHPSISRGGRESNSRPSNRASSALTTRLPGLSVSFWVTLFTSMHRNKRRSKQYLLLPQVAEIVSMKRRQRTSVSPSQTQTFSSFPVQVMSSPWATIPQI